MFDGNMYRDRHDLAVEQKQRLEREHHIAGDYQPEFRLRKRKKSCIVAIILLSLYLIIKTIKQHFQLC
jgi:hypothetical protein